MRFLIIFCCFATFGFPVAAYALSLETQTVRDWEVYCKADRYCIASTKGTATNGETMRFKLERSVAQNNILFVTTAPQPKLEVGMRVKIAADGHDTTYPGAITRVYDYNEMAFKEKTTSGLLDLLKKQDLER